MCLCCRCNRFRIRCATVLFLVGVRSPTQSSLLFPIRQGHCWDAPLQEIFTSWGVVIFAFFWGENASFGGGVICISMQCAACSFWKWHVRMDSWDVFFSRGDVQREMCVGGPENRKTRCLCDGKSLMDGFRKITAVSTISICMGKQSGAQRGVL